MDMEISFPGGKRVDASYHGFEIRTDQSKENGGENTAPAPFDLFLASIGTCAGIYVLSFCQARHIETDNVKIGLDFHRNQQSGMIENINFEVTVPADFPEKYHKAIVRAIDQCAVKKHMINPPQFDIRVSLGD